MAAGPDDAGPADPGGDRGEGDGMGYADLLGSEDERLLRILRGNLAKRARAGRGPDAPDPGEDARRGRMAALAALALARRYARDLAEDERRAVGLDGPGPL